MIYAIVAAAILGAVVLVLHFKGKKENAVEAAEAKRAQAIKEAFPSGEMPAVLADALDNQEHTTVLPQQQALRPYATDTVLMAAIRPEDHPF